MFRVLLPLCLVCAFHVASAQTHLSRVTFPIDEAQTLRDLAKAGLDLTHGHSDRRDAFTTEVQAFELKRMADMGIRFVVDIPDMNVYRKQGGHQHREEALLDCQQRHFDQSIPKNFELGQAGGFFTMPEIIDQLDAMAFLYPHLVSVRQPIGNFKTWQNNSIFWLRISDNPDIDENEPEVLYTGLHHARELITVSQTIYYMWYLLENYDKDPIIRDILNNTELYFVPVLNPDGMNYNIAGYDADDDAFRRNHRKNMRDNNDDGTFDPEYDGVDLNRNYGYQWGFDDEGSNGYPGSDTYRGPSPFSEPETQAMQFFCQQHDFRIALNHHSFGNLLVHPFGYNNTSSADSLLFSHYGELLTELNRFPYGRGMETVGYATNGDSDDWMYGDQGIFSMTPEVGNGDDGFYPTRDRIIPLCQSTLEMNLLAARLVNALVRVTDENSRFLQPGNNSLNLEFTRYGLLDGPVEISFNALSPYITDVPAPFTADLVKFVPYERSLSLRVNPAVPYGASLPLEIEYRQGNYVFRDTLFKVRSDIQLVVDDQGNLSNWDTSGSGAWTTTNESYKSGPVSITDSPGAPYSPNQNAGCMLAEVVDLTTSSSAYAQFWARWDIEDYYDYVLFQASEDGTNWENLCGNHSKPGSLFQQYEEPLYDGRQTTWVKEEIDLSDYLGKNILLRFVLFTDGFVHRDGFYFDDFKVVTVEAGTVSTDPVAAASVRVFPNPADDFVRIQCDAGKPFDVSVVDALGRVMFRREALADGWLSISTANWPSGLYHYSVSLEGRPVASGGLQVVR
jgi:hypothetical protein